jgi:hypothetical protein
MNRKGLSGGKELSRFSMKTTSKCDYKIEFVGFSSPSLNCISKYSLVAARKPAFRSLKHYVGRPVALHLVPRIHSSSKNNVKKKQMQRRRLSEHNDNDNSLHCVTAPNDFCLERHTRSTRSCLRKRDTRVTIVVEQIHESDACHETRKSDDASCDNHQRVTIMSVK